MSNFFVNRRFFESLNMKWRYGIMKTKSIFLTILLLFLSSTCFALSGKVVGVSDGDTITVLTSKRKQVKIRLYGIDCPEKKQAFGQKAKTFAKDLAYGKKVSVRQVAKDRYGRIVGWVSINGKSLNKELLKAGLAWHYKQYSSDSSLASLEIKARKSKRGLWSDSNPIPPWEYRRGKKPQKPTKIKTMGKEIYHGNTKSLIFHDSGCRNFNCKKCSITFRSKAEAIQAGYRPCGLCKP